VAAADQGALFEQEETFTVGQVATRLTRAVAGAFPSEVWVRGEVDGLRPPNGNGHVYLTLCEKARGRDTATISAVLLRTSRQRIERVLAQHPGFRLADGIEVRVRGRVQLAYGRIQLAISEIDPVHTLGRLAAARDRVLAALSADDLLDRNRRVPLPLVPLRVALVTSDGSAACSDVLHELEASGIGFSVRVHDARVQGAGAEPSLLAALTRAARDAPDVVLLVRGGGSRTDLATFDGERIARLIAALPVPVLTGIGHEIDTSVADAVAHLACKTPTACAALVVEQARAGSARAESAWAATSRRAVALGELGERRVEARTAALVTTTQAAVGQAVARLDAHAGRASRVAAVGLATADHRLLESGRRLDRGADRVVDAAAARLDRSRRLLAPERLERGLGSRQAELAAAARRLARTATTSTGALTAALDLLGARASALDPVTALARGWSITRTADGALVRRAGDLVPGAHLRTTLADGTVDSTVDRTADGPTADLPPAAIPPAAIPPAAVPPAAVPPAAIPKALEPRR
jgi:exodeoxyribonuclease VII large subunit